MDETYIKLKGQWKYLYRAVDSSGQTIDFLLTAKRDTAAVLRFFRKAIRHHGEPALVTIDKSGASSAALVPKKTGAAIFLGRSPLMQQNPQKAAQLSAVKAAAK